MVLKSPSPRPRSVGRANGIVARGAAAIRTLTRPLADADALWAQVTELHAFCLGAAVRSIAQHGPLMLKSYM
jgi:hypothetical protein